MAPLMQMSPQALADRVDFGALHAALEAPARNWRGEAQHPGIAQQAAVLVEAMLARPPLAVARRPLAFLTLVLFCEHNGFHLSVTDNARTAFLGGGGRAPADRRSLTDWIE